MCVLSHEDLKKALADGHLVITPVPEIGPDSIDLHWSGEATVINSVKAGALDVRDGARITALMEKKEYDEFVLHCGEVVNVSTEEHITLPNDLIARVTAKSSLARIGLGVGTAVLAHAGWSNQLNLELVNLGRNPITLFKGMGICQITVETLSSPTQYTYGSQGEERFQKGGGNV